MALLSWNEGLSVGIEAIDEQHKIWVDIMNELDDALSKGQGYEALTKIVDRMEGYIYLHFETEEKTMKELHYYDIAKHVESHESFKIEVRELKKDLLFGKPVRATKVMMIIKRWLVDHILIEDKRILNA